MKQIKSCVCSISSTLNECNGHTDSLKENRSDKFLCENGSRSPNCETKIDKTKEERLQIQQRMEYNRSQPCLEHNIIVQSSLNDASNYSKFAFHRIIIHLIVILLIFDVCYTVNGQQQESRQRTQNSTGE